MSWLFAVFEKKPGDQSTPESSVSTAQKAVNDKDQGVAVGNGKIATEKELANETKRTNNEEISMPIQSQRIKDSQEITAEKETQVNES